LPAIQRPTLDTCAGSDASAAVVAGGAMCAGRGDAGPLAALAALRLPAPYPPRGRPRAGGALLVARAEAARPVAPQPALRLFAARGIPCRHRLPADLPAIRYQSVS